MLNQQGFESFRPLIGASQLTAMRETLLDDRRAGRRCLLDEPIVREVARAERRALIEAHRLPTAAVAIQAIACDKTPTANWKVTWHQDVMFPFARPVSMEGFILVSKKANVDYARPPRQVLEALLAVRIHLDDCDETNGPLRVSPAPHRQGVIRSTDLADVVARHGETACLAPLTPC